MPHWDEPTAARRAQWRAMAASLREDAELAEAHQLALRQGFVLTREQARRAGVDDARIRSQLRRERWSNPRRGVLCVLSREAEGAGPAMSASAAHLVRTRSVISHASAAVITGIPVQRAPRRPTLTIAPGGQCNSREDIDLHAAALGSDEVIVWYGQQLTSAARTAIDIARSCGVTAGVVALDAVLHERAAEPAEVEQILKRQTGWPYSRRAHRAVDLADGRSESVLETLVRVCLVSRGVPRPELQVWVDTARGRYRVDMLWPDARVVVEADGLEKYRAGWQTVVDEKRRHEAIERAGYAVLRVTWRELMSDADDVVRRVLAALAR